MPSIVIYVFIYDISSFVVLVVSFQYSQTKGKMYCLIVQWQDWIFTLMAGRSLCGGLHEVGALVSLRPMQAVTVMFSSKSLALHSA